MFVNIGEIVKAQGIKGEIKIKPFTEDIMSFKRLKRIYLNGVAYDIDSARVNGNFVYLVLSGVSDRNSAETLVGLSVEVDRTDLPKPPDGVYLIADIIGCEVYLSDGSFVGKVDYVYQHGSADVYEVEGERNVMFPFLNKMIVSVDIDAKKIFINKQEFDRVAVYED